MADPQWSDEASEHDYGDQSPGMSPQSEYTPNWQAKYGSKYGSRKNDKNLFKIDDFRQKIIQISIFLLTLEIQKFCFRITKDGFTDELT